MGQPKRIGTEASGTADEKAFPSITTESKVTTNTGGPDYHEPPSAAKRRKRTPLTLHHRYRLEHGIYPETMRPVVAELCDEIERLQQVVDELDGAFFRWRHEHQEASRV